MGGPSLRARIKEIIQKNNYPYLGITKILFSGERAKKKGVLGEGNFLPASRRVFLPAAAGDGQFIGSGFVSLTGGLNAVKRW